MSLGAKVTECSNKVLKKPSEIQLNKHRLLALGKIAECSNQSSNKSDTMIRIHKYRLLILIKYTE
jgi:hypothetical protein